MANNEHNAHSQRNINKHLQVLQDSGFNIFSHSKQDRKKKKWNYFHRAKTMCLLKITAIVMLIYVSLSMMSCPLCISIKLADLIFSLWWWKRCWLCWECFERYHSRNCWWPHYIVLAKLTVWLGSKVWQKSNPINEPKICTNPKRNPGFGTALIFTNRKKY